MTASWLKQMGWEEVAVFVANPSDGDWETGRREPRVPGREDAATRAIDAAALRDALAAGTTQVVDLDFSRRYIQSHIPGAWFAIRSRLADAVTKLPASGTIVLTSGDGRLARLAAPELSALVSVPVMVLSGGTRSWVEAGLPLEAGVGRMASEAEDVVLSARERGQNREAAMHEYLAWEIALVTDMAADDDHRFRVVAG
jgi:3-mercaptopyruvate sulfurtransferase SseA